MITVDFSQAVAVYAILVIVSVFVCWVNRRKQKDKNLSLDSRFIWYCSICSYTYINTKEEHISTCPRCGSYNKK